LWGIIKVREEGVKANTNISSKVNVTIIRRLRYGGGGVFKKRRGTRIEVQTLYNVLTAS